MVKTEYLVLSLLGRDNTTTQSFIERLLMMVFRTDAVAVAVNATNGIHCFRTERSSDK